MIGRFIICCLLFSLNVAAQEQDGKEALVHRELPHDQLEGGQPIAQRV
jgi:hypothetical protein